MQTSFYSVAEPETPRARPEIAGGLSMRSGQRLGVPALAGAWRTAEVPDVAKLPPAKAGTRGAQERRYGVTRVHPVKAGMANAEEVIWLLLGFSAVAALWLCL